MKQKPHVPILSWFLDNHSFFSFLTKTKNDDDQRHFGVAVRLRVGRDSTNDLSLCYGYVKFLSPQVGIIISSFIYVLLFSFDF